MSCFSWEDSKPAYSGKENKNQINFSEKIKISKFANLLTDKISPINSRPIVVNCYRTKKINLRFHENRRQFPDQYHNRREYIFTVDNDSKWGPAPIFELAKFQFLFLAHLLLLPSSSTLTQVGSWSNMAKINSKSIFINIFLPTRKNKKAKSFWRTHSQMRRVSDWKINKFYNQK